MASGRNAVTMSDGEIEQFLTDNMKVQIATIGPDGAQHLTTLFYVVEDGQIAFWTYGASQKVVNLRRDPRITCLVEDGEDYFELRGAQVAGVVRRIDDPAEVYEIGRLIAARLPGLPGAVLDDYVARAATKRTAYLVQPRRVVSWDHRRLLT